MTKTENNNDNIENIKVALIGQIGVGKTSLMNVYLGHKFEPNNNCTISSTKNEKELEINNKKLTVEFLGYYWTRTI